MLGSPTVSAVWNGEDDDLGVRITIKAGDDIAQSYTVSVEKDGTELYRNENAAAGELALTSADLGGAALTKDDAVTVTVAVTPVPGYTAPAPVTVNVSQAWGSGEPSGGMGSGEPSGEAEEPAEDASSEPAEDANSEPTDEASGEASAS